MTAAHTPGRVTIKRDQRFMGQTYMDLHHSQAGVQTFVTARITGLRPRYSATRYYPDGGKMSLSASWARSFIAECLRPMRCGGAS